MFYSQKFGVTSNVKKTVILSLAVLVCGACGVRGPLTVNPKPIKGLDGVAAPMPTDLRAAPSGAVLYGANDKQIIIPTTTTTTTTTIVTPATVVTPETK